MLVENYQELGLRLFIESIITVGFYKPSEWFLSGDSVAVMLDGQPILLVGPHDDVDSIEITDRLLASKHFKDLVGYVFGNSILAKGFVSNKLVCTKPEYRCITKSEQGLEEDGNGTGDLVAVLPLDREDFAAGMCINSEIMLCFYPTATPLSKQIGLKPILL